MDDLFIYYGSDMEALNIIIKGIEQIAHDIAPNNYNIKTIEEDDTKNLLRFFK